MNLKKTVITLISSMLFIGLPLKVNAAERINLYINIFSRSISIQELESFAKDGTSQGFLKKILKNQDKEVIRNFLKKEYKAPIELTSRLLYSQIGQVVLKKVAKIIYPNRIPEESISVLALKASTIKTISENNEAISLLGFLKAYPSNIIAINVTELSRIINKVESMNELVKFFSNAPLEKLKKPAN